MEPSKVKGGRAFLQRAITTPKTVLLERAGLAESNAGNRSLLRMKQPWNHLVEFPGPRFPYPFKGNGVAIRSALWV